jgi:hypothetical protein
VLKGHVRFWLKTNTGAEDVGQRTSLLSKGIDNRGSRRCEGGLQHVTEDAEHAVEVLVLARSGSITRLSLPGDARHHLSN